MENETEGARILLVTDDPDSGQAWAYGMAQWGMEVVIVAPCQLPSGGRLDERFALVIVDITAERSAIIELCRRLRTTVTRPILLLAYVRDEPAILAAYQAGVDEVIVKPIGLHLLLAKLAAWLRRSGVIAAGG